MHEIRQIDPKLDNFTEVLDIENYQAIVQAIKNMAKYSEKERKYFLPANATALTMLLKDAAEVL